MPQHSNVPFGKKSQTVDRGGQESNQQTLAKDSPVSVCSSKGTIAARQSEPLLAALFPFTQAHLVRQITFVLTHSPDREIVDFYEYLMNSNQLGEVGEGGMDKFQEELKEDAGREWLLRAMLRYD
ncbi:hypothetical protein BC937DRAFT_87561 [Endogone sp. FLAS-F59071]|nr:hypothetical protein BC937DRAFT_87561 [Endogone sp. FLAS-F59071]|eukprot:RUS19395.1 hypothetical protein BC937DRAFT_87561 [Endogone sp. FLAS-F59071]